MGKIKWAIKRLRVTSFLLVVMMLILNCNYSVWGESLDSDYDGWSDEYERILGTDPYNPDTDGDGIRDPDDPTPRGSFMNTEEVWEAFEFNIHVTPKVCTVGNEITIHVTAPLISPFGGRTDVNDRPIWLYVYVESYYGSLRQDKVLEGEVVDNEAQFSYNTTEPGFHYFIAVINRTGISLGLDAQLYEISKMNSEKRCGFEKVTVYPDYYVTFDVEYEHVSPSFGNLYHIRLWKFDPVNTSEEYMVDYAGSYDPGDLDDLTELYKMSPGEVYVYFNRNGGQIVETVMVGANGTSWNYTISFPAIYEVSMTKYEQQFSWDAALSKKYPYPTKVVYNHPDFITSIEAEYSDLLPGHTDIFHINVLKFKGPSNNASNLYHNASGTVYIHVAEYYATVNSPYIHYDEIFDTSIFIGSEGGTWNYTFTYHAKFAVAATYYQTDFSWYSILFDKPYAKSCITVHDNLISWVEGSEPEIDVFTTKDIKVNRVYIVNINETEFNELFHSIGLIGIAEHHSEYVSNWIGEAWVDVYYIVYNVGYRYVDTGSIYFYKDGRIDEWAFRIHREQVAIDGSGTMVYDFNIPGRYGIAVSFTDPLPLPSHKFDLRMLIDYCEYLSYCVVITDYNVNTFSIKETYFSGEDVQISVTNTNGSGKVITLSMLLFINNPNNYRIENTTDSGYAPFVLTGLSSGTYNFYGMPYFDKKMLDIINELGLEDFGCSRYSRSYHRWIGHEIVYVRDLAIFSNHPSNFVKGLPASFRVVVYDRNMQPLSECLVTVQLHHRHKSGGSWISQTTKVYEMRTDDFGSVLVYFIFPELNHIYYSMRIYARKGDLSDQVQNNIDARYQDISGIITTDKPLYHEGDTIHAKFLVWNADTASPHYGTIDVILTDPYNRDILKVGITPDEYGNCNIDIPLADEMPWGRYTIRLLNQLTGDQITQRGLVIKHYDLPEVKAYFTTDLEYVKVGDEVTLNLSVEYIFGAPVTEGNVTYTITGSKNNYWDYRWWGPIPTLALIINFTATDLENGRSSVTFTVPDSDLDEISVSAKFQDELDHEAAGQHYLSVENSLDNEGEAQIDIESPKTGYLPSEAIPLNISIFRIISEDGEDIEPIADAAFNINISVMNINYSKEVVLDIDLQTDENGLYMTSFSDLGIPFMDHLEKMSYYYIIKVKYEDTDGSVKEDSHELMIYRLQHTVGTDKINYTAGEDCQISFWVRDLYLDQYLEQNFSLNIRQINSKDIFQMDGKLSNHPQLVNWSIPPQVPSGRYQVEVTFKESTVYHTIQIVDEGPNKMILTSSQEDYRPGDSITLSVDLERSHVGWLYFDIMAGDKIVTKQLGINGQSAAISFVCGEWRYPITALGYFIDDHGRIISDSAYIQLDLSKLTIEITINKPTYEPGDTATVTVKVVDEKGDPVPYPLIAISVVDAAVFELEDDLDETGWFDGFRTPYSLNRGYSMKSNWIAGIWYPGYHESESTVFWPNYKPGYYFHGGEYWLYDTNDSDSIYDMTFFSGESIPKVTEGFSQSLQNELENTKVRTWFTETAFWNAGVGIGEEGEYTWDVLLPDNIAQWRIKTIASTKDCLGAVGITYINTTKDFFIEPHIPYIFYQDDEITFKVRVYNFNNYSLTIRVGISAGPWLWVFGANEKELKMNATEVKDVGFLVSIMESGDQNLTVIASDFGDNVDAVIRGVKIRPNGALKTTHLSGAVEHRATEIISYYDEKINGSESAVLRLAVGYQGLLLDGFSSLGEYPYGCTEQTMSKLLPNILMWEYYKATNELTESRKVWLSRLIVLQIQRLYYLQHDDGGWGWWKADATDTWMTAYVLFGLANAENAGFYISPSIKTDAQQCLFNMMDPSMEFWPASGFLEGKDAILSAYVVNALAYSGYSGSLTKQWTYLEEAWNNGDLKDPYGAAFYSMALLKLEKKEKARDPIDWLLDNKEGPHWAQGASLGGADETSGWVAYALALEGNHKADVKGALEWLATQRMHNGGWGTTSDTIAAMFAICEVVKGMEEIKMDVNVYVNGRKIKSVHVDEKVSESMRNFKSTTDAIDLVPYLRDGKNSIEIRMMGKGDLFYELTLVQYLRIGVQVDYEEKTYTSPKELFDVRIWVDPVDSEVMDIANLELDIPDLEGLVFLSSTLNEPGDPDGVYEFINTYYADESGTYNIQPIMISYQLDAGERDSGIIRRYYGPIEVFVSEDETKVGIRDGDKKDSIHLIKRVSKNVLRTGEFVDVTLDIKKIRDLDIDEMKIIDFIPSNFVLVDGGNAECENNKIFWEMSLEGDTALTYTMRALSNANCVLGRAVAIGDDEVLATSDSIGIVSTSQDFYVIRELDNSSVTLYQPVTVNLLVESVNEPVWYVALEDRIGAGCRIDTGSIHVIENSKRVPIEYSMNVQSHKVVGDKIVFFIRCVESISIEYNIIPTLVSRVVVPSAKVYSMYDENKASLSGADLLSVTDPLNLAGLEGEIVLLGPDDISLKGEGGILDNEWLVAALVFGVLTLLIAVPLNSYRRHKFKSTKD